MADKIGFPPIFGQASLMAKPRPTIYSKVIEFPIMSVITISTGTLLYSRIQLS